MSIAPSLHRWFLCLIAAVALASCGSVDADVTAIRNTLHATFDREGTELVIDPVVVSGDHGLADWTQGEMGGRALMRRAGSAWRVILCAGDQIRTAEALLSVGIPESDARALATALAEAERRASPERLAKMASFKDIVRMDGDAAGHH